jgi:hypothetical protein
MSSRPLRVRCRTIEDGDRDAVLNLLLKSGFGGNRAFWTEALQRLSEHPTPESYPKYGYLLEVNNVAVGLLLLICSTIPAAGELKVRCNTSCWTVWPAFQAYGTLLVAQALKHKEATYINISPLPHTFKLMAAQGYKRYCEGRFSALAALIPRFPGVEIAEVSDGTEPGEDLSVDEITLLLEHVDYGCISLVVTAEGRRYPFVFEPTRRYRYIRVAYLTYCRSVDDFVRLAGPLGRYLARLGYLWVDLDANGPLTGLIGHYWKTTPKYYRGSEPPRLGDLAYSERVVIALQFPARIGPQE